MSHHLPGNNPDFSHYYNGQNNKKELGEVENPFSSKKTSKTQ